MIYQIHAIHGRHMAQNHLESSANEKAGWKTVSEKEFYDHGRKPVVQELPTELSTEKTESEDDHAAVTVLYKKTLGKKPHHRMTIDTMKAEINGHSQ